MKKTILITACAFLLALSTQMSPAAEATPAPAGAPAAQVETTPSPTGIRKVGRFFKGAAKAVGGGLKKTGQGLGRVASKTGKGIGKMLGKKSPAAPAPAPAPVR